MHPSKAPKKKTAVINTYHIEYTATFISLTLEFLSACVTVYNNTVELILFEGLC